MLLRIITLFFVYLFVCQKAKISRGTSVRAFLRWFSPSLQDKSRSLFNGCKNQSKEIHVSVYNFWALEYTTIQKRQKSSKKYIECFCWTVICQFINRKVSSKKFCTNYYNSQQKTWWFFFCVQYKTALLIVWCSCEVVTFWKRCAIFLPDARKLRILQDINYVRTTYVEFTMTIFRQCHNVLNNK